jgi:hypothetical protein
MKKLLLIGLLFAHPQVWADTNLKIGAAANLVQVPGAAMAYAPPIAPTSVCMGSTSAGASGVGFGVSIGSSWTDDNCVVLEQVRIVSTVLRDNTTAEQMMCQFPAYAQARSVIGRPCK